MAGIWPCGVITLLDELYISESKSQVYGAIHSFFLNNENSMSDLSKKQKYCMLFSTCVLFLYIEYICYDDGCHLRKFSQNPIRRSQSTTAERIASLEIVVDKMHFKGHVDAWCKQHCDPYKHSHLDKVYACILELDITL